MSGRIAGTAVALVAACSPTDTPPAPTPTTTTTVPPTTTTIAPVTTTVVRATTTTTGATVVTSTPPPQAAAEGAGVEEPADFWHRLAMCESGMRITHNRYVGLFQFSRDTAAKVSIDGSEAYEEQRAAAIEWARRIHPREGTSSGWPVCWWKAAA